MIIYETRETQLALQYWLRYLYKWNQPEEKRLNNYLDRFAHPSSEMMVIREGGWPKVTLTLNESIPGVDWGEMPPVKCFKCEGAGFYAEQSKSGECFNKDCEPCEGTGKLAGASYIKEHPVEHQVSSAFAFCLYHIYDDEGRMMDRKDWKFIYNGGLISHCNGNPRKTSWGMHT